MQNEEDSSLKNQCSLLRSPDSDANKPRMAGSNGDGQEENAARDANDSGWAPPHYYVGHENSCMTVIYS